MRKVLSKGRFLRHRDGFTLGDALSQGIRSVSSHPGRLAMTCLAVALGIGALVATIGFAQTGSGQIAATFDSVAATSILVEPAAAETDQTMIPWDAEKRAIRLNGVVGAGTLTNVSENVRSVSSLPLNDPEALPHGRPAVVAASPGLLAVIAGRVQQGAFINTFQDDTAQAVAVLGRQAAENLNIRRLDVRQAIFINEEPYTVIGIVEGMQRHPELESAIIIPQSTARQRLELTAVLEVQVRIEVGAGPVVSPQLAYALNPSDPTSLIVSAPSASGALKERLSSDVNILFLALGLTAAGIGALTIAVATSLSVMERKGEIGLRRALGATGSQIALLLLAECATTGLLGGLIGAGTGTCAVVAIAAANQWTPILDIALVAVAAVSGILLGLVAGLVPAIRASMIEPATALQEGT
jgi:putative ABC transport system permease protein